jgi:GNAT superfamily N-acetyltransferase
MLQPLILPIPNQNIEILPLTVPMWERHWPQIMKIENRSYEPTRRRSQNFLSKIMTNPKGIVMGAFHEEQMVGFCFGVPIEVIGEQRGITDDSEFGKQTTFYSIDLAVDASYRRKGIGTRLKMAQIERAKSKGFNYIAGRVRFGLGDIMWKIIENVGGYQIRLLKNFYKDDFGSGDVHYYCINLRSFNLNLVGRPLTQLGKIVPSATPGQKQWATL